MSSTKFIPAARVGPALMLAAMLAGCDRSEVKVYEVPKEASTATAPSGLTWTLPEGWQEVPAAQMRLASFAVTGADGKKADVSIVPLDGAAGGDLGNVNRWRGQVGLAPVGEEELSKLGEKVEVAGAEAMLYDLPGDKARILATTLPRNGTSYFFKMMGDGELLARQKPKFIAFLKSVKFDSIAATATALPPSHPPIGGNNPAMPPGHPPLGMTPPVMASSDNPAKPQWTVPPGWTEEPPTQMLLAKFSTGDPDARAEITVSSFPGAVGGLGANINRWRGQLSLPLVDEATATQAATSLEVAAGKGSLVQLDGNSVKTGQPARLIGVAVPHGDQTWFFKMMGDEKIVSREKEAFIKFVQTAKLPHAP